jgi:hypothetical protein
VRNVDAGRAQVRLDQRGQPGQCRRLVFPVVVDQAVPGGGIGPGAKRGRHRQQRAVGQQIVGQRRRQFVDPRVVRIPGQRVPAALRQLDELGVVEPVFELGQEVVEALRKQRPPEDQSLPLRGHVVVAKAELGVSVQDRAGPVGQQDPVAMGEPVQRVAARDQLIDPFGESTLDIGQGGGEPLRINVEKIGDLGQWHARPGQGPDLDQPEQVSRPVAPVAGIVTFRLVDQAEPVIVPHRLHRDAGERRRLTGREPVRHSPAVPSWLTSLAARARTRLDELSWSWDAPTSPRVGSVPPLDNLTKLCDVRLLNRGRP